MGLDGRLVHLGLTLTLTRTRTLASPTLALLTLTLTLSRSLSLSLTLAHLGLAAQDLELLLAQPALHELQLPVVLDDLLLRGR